jgi:hypothetical protein
VHDIPDSVAQRALRTLVAYAEVVCLDGELHVRPGTSLQPPPPPPFPMAAMLAQMGPQMLAQMGPQMMAQMGPQMMAQMGPQMMAQMGPMGSGPMGAGPMGGLAAPAVAMAQGRPISHQGAMAHLALLMKHPADLQAARAAQMGQGGPPRR